MGAPLSRRRFLGMVGAGAAAWGAQNVLGLSAAEASPVVRSDRFGRMFRLPPFADQSPQLEATLREIGRPGGLMDAADALERGPIALILDPGPNADNPAHTAGVTFVGQFLDHDMTFDVGSRLGVPTNPERATNGRTPALDLDSVYGGGPTVSPQLYDPADRARLRVESGGAFEDLPRGSDGTAIIGDPRNDENLLIAGLHAAFLLFHNAAVDAVRHSGRTDPATAFAEARRLTTWHYQWLIVHEFLPLFVGQAMVDDISQHGPRVYRPAVGEAFIPVEFQGAAYRFGHSLVRPSYRANLGADVPGRRDDLPPFFGFVFDAAIPETEPDPDDLRGGHRACRRFVGWQTFFEFGDGEVKRNKRIDTLISTPLFHLPLGAIASHDLPTALPQRNLLRHLTWQLPSGQAIAAATGVPALAPADLDDLAVFGLDLDRSTPLWFYVLREAHLVADGRHLGPVGGRIVAEVILGLLASDQGSFLVREPGWQPLFGPRAGEFRMVDFLRFAGVDPVSRGR